jgi:hypothetical protein
MRKTFYSVVTLISDANNLEDAKKIFKGIYSNFDKPISDIGLKKYHNDEKSFQISFKIKQEDNTPDKALKEIGDILGQGWDYTFMEDDEDFTSYAIWNKSDSSSFISDRITFANLETYLPS